MAGSGTPGIGFVSGGRIGTGRAPIEVAPSTLPGPMELARTMVDDEQHEAFMDRQFPEHTTLPESHRLALRANIMQNTLRAGKPSYQGGLTPATYAMSSRDSQASLGSGSEASGLTLGGEGMAGLGSALPLVNASGAAAFAPSVAPTNTTSTTSILPPPPPPPPPAAAPAPAPARDISSSLRASAARLTSALRGPPTRAAAAIRRSVSPAIIAPATLAAPPALAAPPTLASSGSSSSSSSYSAALPVVTTSLVPVIGSNSTSLTPPQAHGGAVSRSFSDLPDPLPPAEERWRFALRMANLVLLLVIVIYWAIVATGADVQLPRAAWYPLMLGQVMLSVLGSLRLNAAFDGPPHAMRLVAPSVAPILQTLLYEEASEAQDAAPGSKRQRGVAWMGVVLTSLQMVVVFM